ncbi:TPA: PspA/IM30 family protein [Candidatus Poribacteria bacterium]|nr:PspA/IM30 family protein [Candidatus Poribacteria bacterium]
MGVFDRISSIFKANVNHLLSKAEDPEKMLNQIVLEMNEQLAKTKQQVTAAIADEKRLEKQYKHEESQVQEWERKAALAVQRENDTLAKEALARRNEHQNLANEYKIQWEKQKQAVDELKESLRALERKIEEAARKKNLLIARQKRAKAQKQIHETMAGMRDGSAFESFERMEEKVTDMEARADAAVEMAQTEDVKLEDQFAELEKEGSIDDDLAALKAKVSSQSQA